MKEAKFYDKLKDKKVQCGLCTRNCMILEGKTGICRARKNTKGKLYSLVYGKIVSMAVDSIEKKPLFHFFPGSQTLSIATVGCTFKCKFCQNWDIAQATEIKGEDYTPKEIVDLAIKYNTKIISYTYTEPAVSYEFAYDTAKIAHKKGLRNVFVTNGYINKKPLEEIAPYLDAANVDLKAFDTKFAKELSLVPDFKPVLETIRNMHKLGIHVEITNLLIPGWNTKEDQIKKLSEWIYKLDENIPVHFSRFFPAYKLNIEPTSLETIEKAYKIAKKVGLKYVYLGNVRAEKEDTHCPKCKTLLVKRSEGVIENKLKNTNCFSCGETIPIIS